MRNWRMHQGGRRPTWARRPRVRLTAVATIVSGAVVLAGCGATQDDAASSDPALLVADQLFEAFNTEDAEEVAAIFGDDVAFTLESGEDVVGPEATAFWQSYFGRETAERVSDGFRPSDGRTIFLADLTRTVSRWTSTLVFEVEMDGERLVRMGARPKQVEELIATGEIDDLHAAVNDRNADRLAELFAGMKYESSSGAESSGPAAAEQWADGFGFTVTRASEVFEIDDGVFWFVSEHRQRDSDRSTTYEVEVEVDVSGGARITSMTERGPEG